MPNVKLTARALSTLPPGDHPDQVRPGLVFRVRSSGARTFAVRYRNAAGRSLRYTLGSIERLGGVNTALATARELARKALADVAHGGDPQAAKREKRAEHERRRNALTVRKLIADFLVDREESLASNTLRGWRGLLANHIEGSAIGETLAAELSRREVKELLKATRKRGLNTTANRVLELLRVAYAWAMDEELLIGSPCAGISKREEQPRDRVLSSDELRRVWMASDSEGVAGAAIRFAILSGQRKGEILGMKRAELDLAAAAGLWRIPASRMKGARSHTLPLSVDLRGIIESIPEDGPFVFASADPKRPIATLQHAHRRMTEASDVSGWTIHDLRRTCRSGLSEVGVNADVAERIMAHAPERLRETYDRHLPVLAMRDGLERWARRVREIVEGAEEKRGEVVPITRR
jgi:integrase